MLSNAEALFARYQTDADVIGACFRIPGADLADVQQEAKLKLWQVALKYDPLNPPTGSYVRECLRNHLRDLYRRAKPLLKGTSIDQPIAQSEDGDEQCLADTLADPAASPEQQAADNEERELLARAIASLPDEDRQLITMSFGLNGQTVRTVREIAELTGRSKSAVDRRIHTLLVQLHLLVFGEGHPA